MKNNFKFLSKIVLCFFLISPCFASCSDDNEDEVVKTSRQESIKSDLDSIGSLFLREFDSNDYKDALILANDFRNKQVAYQVDNTSIRNFVFYELQMLLTGDLVAIPRMLATISSVEGNYVADDENEEWDKTGDTSDCFSLHFTDNDGNDCELDANWDYTNRSQLAIYAEDTTLVIEVPGEMVVSMKKNGVTLIRATNTFSIKQEGLNGSLNLEMNKLCLDAVFSFDNEKIQLDNSFTKNGKNLMTSTLTVNSPGLLASLMTDSTDLSTLKEITTTINILDNQLILNGKCDGIDALTAIGMFKMYYAGDGTHTQAHAQALCDSLNQGIFITAKTPRSDGEFAIKAAPYEKETGWDWTPSLVLNNGESVLLYSLFGDFKSGNLYAFIKGLGLKLNDILAQPVTGLLHNGSVYTAPDGTQTTSEIYEAPNGKKYDIVDPSGWKNSFYSFASAMSFETDIWKLPVTEGETEACEHRGTDMVTYEELLGITLNEDGSNPLYEDLILYSEEFFKIFPTFAKYWAGTTAEGDRKGAYFIRVESKDYLTLDWMEHNKMLFKHVRLIKRHEE